MHKLRLSFGFVVELAFPMLMYFVYTPLLKANSPRTQRKYLLLQQSNFVKVY